MPFSAQLLYPCHRTYRGPLVVSFLTDSLEAVNIRCHNPRPEFESQGTLYSNRLASQKSSFALGTASTKTPDFRNRH